jgi:hypothetical protein
MNTSWDHLANLVQDYLMRGVIPLPSLYAEFLEALAEGEAKHQLCLLPSSRFELYHIRLEKRLWSRITNIMRKRKQAA